MSNLLDQAFEALRKLPAAQQEEYARALMDALQIDEKGIHILTKEERASIEKSRTETQRGEFVPDEEVDAYWRSLGI